MKNSTSRRQAREAALQLIFHFFFEQKKPPFDISDKDNLRQDIEERMQQLASTIDPPVHPKNYSFVYKLIEGVALHFEELEKWVEGQLKNWRLNRLSKIEHALLVLAAEEIRYGKETPDNVIINEYIEMAKKFGGKDSGAFMNGVLDAMVKSQTKT